MAWALAGAAGLVYWVLSLREGHSVFRSTVKGLAVAPLALLAAAQGAWAVALALALCSLGDVVLSRPGERAFLGGLIAFAVGHLAWIAVFATRFGLSGTQLVTPGRLLALIAVGVLALVMARVLLPRAGALRGPVAVYLGIIFCMALAALATPVPLIVAGALLFVGSDALLGLQTFALTAGTAPERVANGLIWPLYWGAIALMSLAA